MINPVYCIGLVLRRRVRCGMLSVKDAIQRGRDPDVTVHGFSTSSRNLSWSVAWARWIINMAFPSSRRPIILLRFPPMHSSHPTQ